MPNGCPRRSASCGSAERSADRNPLRRRCDRAEAAIVAGLLAGFLAAAPAAALAAGHWAYTVSLRTEHAQQAARHQVPAVLLENAPAGPAQELSLHPQARARWAAPDGTPHTGPVTVTAGATAGSTVMVWADASGRLHSPPLRHDKVTARAVLAAICAPLLAGLFLLGTGILALWRLDRRRLAAWEADWSVTGPHWTSTR
jgi:hypothetical protein